MKYDNPWNLSPARVRVIEQLTITPTHAAAGKVLGISPSTIDVHMRSIFTCMGVRPLLLVILKYDRWIMDEEAPDHTAPKRNLKHNPWGLSTELIDVLIARRDDASVVKMAARLGIGMAAVDCRIRKIKEKMGVVSSIHTGLLWDRWARSDSGAKPRL